jgi:SAM-dependent methyltransferase
LRNIAAMPLLWVAPLALYLLSLVMAFDSPRWYWRPAWYGWFAVVTGAMIYLVVGLFLVRNFLPQLLFYLAGFFVCCMVCHGELAALKPSPRHLSGYYLTIAAGGALGGLLVAGVAPLLFKADYDMPILLPATVLLVTSVIMWRWPPHWSRLWRNSVLALILLALFIDTGAMIRRLSELYASTIFAERNFYGPLKVAQVDNARYLQNGNVVHGREMLGPDKAREPASYYGRHSGVGLALAALEARGPVKVGMVGLGAGTIAAYGRPGDVVTFYEINPAVPVIAKNYFSYLSLTGARVNIRMGDARLSLEREPPQRYDLLAIDAFTSDSIPVHLLTREAFAQYWRHLKPGGVLAVHISNLYIDLAPVVAAAALDDGKIAREISDYGDESKEEDYSDWVLITADPAFFDTPVLAKAGPEYIPASVKPWTDDYSNLWRSLR